VDQISSGPRWVIIPDLIDQLLGGYQPAFCRYQHGQHQAVFGVTKVDALPSQLDRDPSK